MRRIPATASYAGSYEELRGIPGAMTEYQLGPTNVSHDVCCPGCGKEVYQLNGVSYPMTGSCNGTNSLTCLIPVRFKPCGCGAWRLEAGVWEELPDLRELPPPGGGKLYT